jgi:hypothetical protein
MQCVLETSIYIANRTDAAFLERFISCIVLFRFRFAVAIAFVAATTCFRKFFFGGGRVGFLYHSVYC